MAEKRMFSKKIIDSDAFLEMPLSAQALYFHLNMRADDDGFINNPKNIARYINASEDDLRLLVVKRFVITFENGVIVIKHWRMHNTLRADRYTPTDYQEEFATLGIKPNKSYTEDLSQGAPILPKKKSVAKRLPSGCQSGTSDIGIGKDIGLGLDRDIDKEFIKPIDNSKGIDSSSSSIGEKQPVIPHHAEISMHAAPNMGELTLDDAEIIIQAWDELGLPGKVTLKPYTKRWGAVNWLCKNYGMESILKTIHLVGESDHLMGRKPNSTWRVTFDWFIDRDNFAKVLDGNYSETWKTPPKIAADDGTKTNNIFLKIYEEEYGNAEE